ncbi:MAG: rhodanese-like domain-containing protein [Akkermansiaceae bacterium]|jgi:rhodanese-related sulfurtransferase|nr:rhodanese-like domain-containing protein [Akkermansiaceae bacterium]
MKLPKLITTFLSSALLLTLTSCDTKELVTVKEDATLGVEFQIQNVTAEEAKVLLSIDSAPQVIDLRTPEEFATGHLPGAVMIDFKSPDFKTELAKLDTSKEYLFHCKSGGRSTQSLDAWKELGFGKLHHLNKGMLSWTEAGNPTE